MKSAVVALVLVISACNAADVLSTNELNIGEEDPVTKTFFNDTTTANEPITEDATARNEDESSTTDPTLTTMQTGTSTAKQDVTSAPNKIQTESPTVYQTSTPPGGKRKLSTVIDKSKCLSLGLEEPKGDGCKCYQQKSPGTDLPSGYCYFFQCTDSRMSKHTCEFNE